MRNGHTVIIDSDFSAGQYNAASGTVALTGAFVVEAGVTLTINGDWNAAQTGTQNTLNAGAAIVFDGASGTSRSYLAAAGYYGAPSLVVDATPDNKAFFGLKAGSEATFAYNKQGFLGSNIRGGNVHLNGFSTGYIHDGYDRATTRDCEMPNVLMTNSGKFELRYIAGDNGTCDYSNLTILSPTVTDAFRTVGSAASTTQSSAYNLNGLSVDGNVQFYTRPEFTMNDWVVKNLDATLPTIGWQNADSWLLFNAHGVPAGSAKTSNVYFRAERYSPRAFNMKGSSHTQRHVDSAIFELNNLDSNQPGDAYLFSELVNPETVRISNNVVLKNANGQQSSAFVSFVNSNTTGRQVELENNVVFTPWYYQAIAVDAASVTPAGSLSSVKNNLFWGDDAGKEGYVIGSYAPNNTDILSQGAYDNNGVFNARTDGSHNELNLPLSYTPNAPIAQVAPAFVDDQRRLSTYGASQLSLDGTAQSAFNAFLTPKPAQQRPRPPD